MVPSSVHAQRRLQLARELPDQHLLLMGNGDRPRNLRMAPVPFRQDSTFLYFTGCTRPGAALYLGDGESTLFLPEPAEDDALWHGAVHSLAEQASTLGFDRARPAHQLESFVASQGAEPLTLAVPDLAQTLRASAITGRTLVFGEDNGPIELVDAVARLRMHLDGHEVDEMRAAARVTEAAHREAMAHTRPGAHERELATRFRTEIWKAGMVEAYTSIVTVRGEVLHNNDYVNILDANHLLLLDGGAEAPSGYATDVTRTWPVSGRFSPRQRAAYDAVLAAQDASIAMLAPGVRYRQVHDASSLVLARFLADEGLIRCAPEDAVQAGAHALFFPHGVGHLLGLDVHDLEAFGDRVLYPGRARSTQFGTAYLRIDLDLAAGMVVTIEPGFYVVPAILNDPVLVERFRHLVDFDRARSWIGFGGIRIEDDVLITVSGHELLTDGIPKAPDAIEAAVGAAA